MTRTSSFQSMPASSCVGIRSSDYWNDAPEGNSSAARSTRGVPGDGVGGEGGRRVAELEHAVGGDGCLLEVQRAAERRPDIGPERRAAVVGQHDAVVGARLLRRGV